MILFRAHRSPPRNARAAAIGAIDAAATVDQGIGHMLLAIRLEIGNRRIEGDRSGTAIEHHHAIIGGERSAWPRSNVRSETP